MKDKEINFQSLLNDYRRNFSNKRFRITTNYNLLSSIDIFFSENNFPHLMGWGKVIDKHSSSKNILERVDEGSFNLKIAQKHSNWNNIKSRMLHYDILHKIFIDQSIHVLVLTRDMKPNRLKLDVVFVINDPINKESIILGFRKASNSEVFYPTTLHTENINNDYNFRKRTVITSIKWISY